MDSHVDSGRNPTIWQQYLCALSMRIKSFHYIITDSALQRKVNVCKQVFDMVAGKLQNLIKQQNVKQIELAGYLGISPSRLSNYVSGKREPDIDMLSRIARYFKVDLNYFNTRFVTYDMPEEIIQGDFLPDYGTTKVPCIKMNGGRQSKPHREIALDNCLLGGIASPLMIESIANISPAKIRTGALIMTDIYKHGDESSMLIQTGKHYNLYESITIDGRQFFLNLREQKLVTMKESEVYYAVKWILQ